MDPSRGTGFGVAFGEGSVTIDSEDPALRREISSLLRHCCSPGETNSVRSPTTSLVVRVADGEQQILAQDGQEILRSSSAAALIERVLYETTVSVARANRSSLVLHAAGIAVGSAGIVLCGESGAGKSTLAACSIRAGFNLLSDELIRIEPPLGPMRGFPRPLVLKDVGVAPRTNLPPDQVQSRAVTEARGISYVDPEEIRSGCLQQEAKVTFLVFPRYTSNSSPIVQRLTPAAAVFRLLPRVVNAQNLPRRGIEAVITLAKNVPAYAAIYPDASLIVRRLHQLVESQPAASDAARRAPRASCF